MPQKQSGPRKQLRLAALLLMLGLIAYFLIYPTFAPATEMRASVTAQALSGRPAVQVQLIVTSYCGDYLIQSAHKPLLHIEGCTEPLTMKLRPFHAKPTFLSRYVSGKQVKTYDFIAEPFGPVSSSAKSSTGTVELSFKLLSEPEAPILHDIFYALHCLTQARQSGLHNTPAQLLKVRQPVTFQ